MKPITLSFDNGPTPGITDEVLSILARYDVRSTFFVIGNKVRASAKASDLVTLAKRHGHWIGNHTDSHSIPLGRVEPPEAAIAEIERAQQTMGEAVHPNRLFRPFGGGGRLGPDLLNKSALDVLIRDRYTCVIWNSVPGDWPTPENTHGAWVERAQHQIRDLDWPLVVLHDIEGACLERLDEFLTWLKTENYDVRQEFPEDCLLIKDGSIQPDRNLDQLISG